jgi:cytochrome P450
MSIAILGNAFRGPLESELTDQTLSCEPGARSATVESVTRRPKRALPGPRSLRPFGCFSAFAADPLSFLTDTARRYGDMSRARFGIHDVVFLNRPDLIESVLISRQGCVVKGVGLSVNRAFFGRGLFVAEGDLWREERRAAQPFFSTESLNTYIPAMTALIQERVRSWQDGVLDVQREMNALAVEAVGYALFGTRDLDPDHLANIFTAVTDRLLDFFRRLRHRFGVTVGRSYAQVLRACDDLAVRLTDGCPLTGAGTYLGKLVERMNRGVIDQGMVRDQIVNVLFGGHVTTALSASFALHLLAHSVEVQDRLRDTIMGADGLTSVQDLQKLPDVVAVINETLRLYPPVWAQSRMLAKPMVLDGVHLTKGTRVVMSPFVMHRHPRYFDAANQFDPARWTPSFEAALPNGAFFPFGLGPRACIGQRFAQVEVAALLLEIVKRYRIRPVSERCPRLVPTVGLRPVTPLRIDIQRIPSSQLSRQVVLPKL